MVGLEGLDANFVQILSCLTASVKICFVEPFTILNCCNDSGNEINRLKQKKKLTNHIRRCDKAKMLVAGSENRGISCVTQERYHSPV